MSKLAEPRTETKNMFFFLAEQRQVNIIPASWRYNNGRCPEGRDETTKRGARF